MNNVKSEIIDFLEKLRLRLHENKSRVYRTSEGVDFLGFRIFPDHMRVRKSIVKRFRKRLRKLTIDYREGKIDLKKVNNSIQSWIGHVGHADSYMLRKELFSSVVFRCASTRSCGNLPAKAGVLFSMEIRRVRLIESSPAPASAA